MPIPSVSSSSRRSSPVLAVRLAPIGSSLSRNRKTGLELAQGKSLEEITGGTPMVAEGIRNSLAISRLAAARGVEMPITRQIVAILYEGKDPRQAVEELMTRELKDEMEL